MMRADGGATVRARGRNYNGLGEGEPAVPFPPLLPLLYWRNANRILLGFLLAACCECSFTPLNLRPECVRAYLAHNVLFVYNDD